MGNKEKLLGLRKVKSKAWLLGWEEMGTKRDKLSSLLLTQTALTFGDEQTYGENECSFYLFPIELDIVPLTTTTKNHKGSCNLNLACFKLQSISNDSKD